jgi:DNA-binding MarR family transcriptional regulator
MLVRPTSPATAAWMQTIAKMDLTLPQVKLLGFLEDGAEIALKDLAATMQLSLPAVSRAVDGLVQRELVDRYESAEDRRSRLVKLSPNGREVLEQVIAARVSAFASLIMTLTEEERTALHDALIPIVERIGSQ